MLGFRIQDLGFRGAKKAFSIQDSGFRIQDSGELFLHFSILPPQHVRHASAGWHPIFFFPKNAKKVSVASFGTTKMGFQTPFSFVSLAQRRRENVSGMTGVGVGDERKDSTFRIQDLGFRIQDSGFSVQDSGELLLHFSILPPQHVRHASAGWHPILVVSKLATLMFLAIFGNKQMGFRICAHYRSLVRNDGVLLESFS
ncbi:MAG: hypothetical protein AB7S81_07475 [Bdellovibrionales bacterium]